MDASLYLLFIEMIESSSTVFSAIKENELLQRAFSELLNGPDVIQDITTLLNNVILCLLLFYNMSY